MAEWKRVRLGEVCAVDYGTRIRKADSTGNEYPVYGGGGETFRWATFNRENQFVISRFAISEHCVRYVRGKFFLNDSGLTLKANENICCQRFLDYAMLSREAEIYNLADGSVQRNLNVEEFRKIAINLPPLSTQKRIAAVLGAIDDKIETNRKICANLEAQAQALFNAAMRRKTSEPFTSNIDILSGGTPKTSEATYWGGDIPFFSPKDIGYPYAISTERSITKDGLNNCNSALYGKDTTFVTARGTVGKVCLAGVPMAMNQSCFALASYKLDPLLVYFYAKAAMNSLRWKANGSVFDAITVAEFETENIVRLTDEEESTFVRLVRPMFDTILSKIKESRALAELRDALLPRLMSGEIDVEKVEVA